MIALTGQLASTRYDIVTHQKLDLGAVFAPVTKWHARVLPENVRAVTSRAIRVATRHRPGPVHLEVASDVAGREAQDDRTFTTRSSRSAGHVAAGDVTEVLAALRASRRPMLLVGIDALSDGVVEPLRTLAEAWSVPVMVGPKAKGIFAEDHPLFLGTIEMLGTGRLYDILDECDLVVMIGMEPVEFDRDWTAPATIVHIGPSPNDDLYFNADLELVGPMSGVLTALNEADLAPEPRWDAAEVRQLRGEFVAFVHPDIGALGAQDVLRELRAILPRDALVTCDVGQNKSVTGQVWPAYQPRTFFMSNGLSSMGYGLPAAMALQLAEPERQVACILGDGGFGMYLGEVETAVRLKLPIVIVILADAALTQIKMNQSRRGFSATGTEFNPIDYVSLARSLGADGREVSTVEECRDAIRWAVGADGPTLIAARIDPRCYELESMVNGADVVIVGGGIIGLAAAFSIVERTDSRVLVLEAKDELGSGATAKATGGIRHQFSTETNARLTQLSMARYERFEEEMGQSIGLRQHGYLLVTGRPDTWREIQRSVAMQQALDIPSRLVSAEEAAQLFPHLRTDDLLGGSFCPIDGSGNASDALQGYRVQARKRGVEFRLSERVDSFIIQDGAVRGVCSSTGEYLAPIVINAAGPAAAALAEKAGVHLPAKPYRRQVFVAAPIDWLEPGLPMLVDLDTGWYLHQEAAGTILLGGTDATRRPGTVETVDWEAFDDVAEAASKRVPEIADAVRIQSAFCGIRTVTPDHHPVIGPVSSLRGYICATACNGHGFMHAPAVGRLVAEAVVHGAPQSIPAGQFAIERFSSAPLGRETVVF